MSEFARELKKAYENPNDYRLIKRLPEYHDLPHVFHEAIGPTKDIVIVDMETTGFDTVADEAIQLAMIHVTIDTDYGRLVSVNKTYNMFNEPLLTVISEKITELTGITPGMVKGCEFNVSEVMEFVGDSKNTYIVAHNSKFDYKFAVRYFPELENYQWGCTMADINWLGEFGIGSNKLEFIAFQNGYFYDAHNALVDCFAVVSAFKENEGVITSLIDNLSVQKFSVSAVGAPFEIKDKLKENHFRWNGDRKVWYKPDLVKEEVEDALRLLITLYDHDKKFAKITLQKGNMRFAI